MPHAPSPPPGSRRRAAVPAILMAATILGVGIATKCHAVWSSGVPVPIAGWPRLLAADFALGGAWLVAWSLVLWGFRGFAAPVAGFFHGVIGIGVLAATAAAHSFWLATGSTLDFPMVAYASQNAGMLAGIVGSEVGIGSVFGVGLLVALPWGLHKLSGGRVGELLARGVGLAGTIAVVALSAPWWPSPQDLPGRLQPLRPQAALTLVHGAVDAWQGVRADLNDIEVATAPMQPVIVRKTAATKPYNVLLFVLESARADALTTYNPARKTMPFVDKLARTGLVVERSYTTVPHTTKSLVPIHCGIQPQIAAGFAESTPGALPGDCLARVLRRLGYATAYFQASESFFERQRDLVAQYGYEDFYGLKDIPARDFETVNYFGLEDKAMLAPALAWIDKHPNQPFLLSFITLISHHPYTMPTAWQMHQWSNNNDENGYLNALRYTDELIEELVDGLRERGRSEDTLIIIVGDHGEGFGEHGLRQHDAILYEEGIRVPFVLHGAGIEATGRRIGGLRNHVDIMPTALDVLGLEVVAGTLDGTSVLTTPGPDELPISCWYQDRCIGMLHRQKAANSAAVQDAKGSLFKTLWHHGHRGAEVFDLDLDPTEQTNLLGTPGHTAADVQKRVARLATWKATINARYREQAEQRRNPWVHRDKPPIGTPCDIHFGDAIRLVGWELEPGPVKAGEALWATYVFEVRAPPPPTWRLFVHADGPLGALEKADHVPVEGSYPVASWQVGDFVVDRNYVRFDPGAQAGAWRLSMGFWDHKTGKRVAAAGEGLTVTARNKVVIGEVQLLNPKRPAPPRGRDALAPQHRHLVSTALPPVQPGHTATDSGARIGDFAVHRRSSVKPAHPAPGGKIDIEHVFEAIGAAPRDTKLFAHVIGPDGRFLNADHTPVAGLLAPDRWRVGEFIADRHTVTLPADWPAGVTSIRLGFWSPELATAANRAPVTGGRHNGKSSAHAADVVVRVGVADPSLAPAGQDP